MFDQAGAVETILTYQHPRAERRACIRYHSSQGAVSRPLEHPAGISWGAVIDTISASGIGLIVCYPFKPQTLLTVDLPNRGARRSLLAEVVHVNEHTTGNWVVGCAFTTTLSEAELEGLLE